MTLPPFKDKHRQKFGGFIIIIIGILVMIAPVLFYTEIDRVTYTAFIFGGIIGVIGLFYLIDAL